MSTRKKILFLTSRIPYPLEKGDKLRVFYQIKYLSKNSDIILCCVSQEDLTLDAESELKKYVQEIYVYKTSKLSIVANMLVAGLNKLPFQVGFFFNTGAHYLFHEAIVKEKPDHIFVQLIRMAEYVSKEKSIPKSLDYMDTFSKGIQRRMEKASGIKKLAFKFEYNRLRKYEAKVYSEFKNTYIISEQDKQSFDFPDASGIKVSPNGVDHHFFQPKKDTPKNYDIVFTGNMSYPPNVSAVLYIAKEIMPILVKRMPEIKLLIAGATPTNAVKSLANKNIKVTGWLDDIRDAYNQAKIFLAPLQIGTGLQNKLLEAMSMELPCITSELANNALKAEKNHEILLGKTPQDYADLVLQLIEDVTFSEQIAKNGKLFVTNTFNWNAIAQDLERDFFANS